jgi:cytoskeleton protein RodZ
MGKSGFGEVLRREREMRGVSRDEICAATRISNRFLEALETEQWAILPGGIFNRGFVRAVARFLGLDEDDLLAEYDLAMIEQHSRPEVPLRPLPPPPSTRTPRRHRFVLGSACVALVLGMSWLGWSWRDGMVRRSTHANINVPSVVPAAVQPEGITPPENSAVTSSAPTAAAATPRNAGTQPLELKIEAGKATTLSVSADGSKIFEGDIIAGQSRTFTAQEAIDISAKDAGALLLELNGQTLAPLGAPGQPGNVTLTRSDLKPSGGGAD